MTSIKHYSNSKRSSSRKLLHSQDTWRNVTAPFGYKNTKRNGRPFIVPDPNIIPILKDIFESYMKIKKDGSYMKISLSRMVLEKYDLWIAPTTMMVIINNKFYTGNLKINKLNNEITAHPYELVIPKEFIEECQLLAQQDIPKSEKEKNEYVFSSIIKCGICGEFLYGSTRGLREKYLCRDFKSENGKKHKQLSIDAGIIRQKVALILHSLGINLYILNNKPKLHKLFVLLFEDFYVDKNKIIFYKLNENIDKEIFSKTMGFELNYNSSQNIESGNDPILKLCKNPMTFDDLIIKLNIDPAILNNRLFDLQLNGQIEQDSSGKWVTKERK